MQSVNLPISACILLYKLYAKVVVIFQAACFLNPLLICFNTYGRLQDITFK